MKKQLIGALFLVGTVMTGCNWTVSNDPGYSGWYNVYGNSCGSLRAGCNYWWDGLKIVDYEDPYYSGNYVWSNYYSWYYGQYVWESPSGLVYDQYGNCLNKASAPKINRDLLTVVSESEAKTINVAAQALASQYKLSSETSLKVARSFSDYAKLGFLRGNKGRTEADIADFTKRLYGVDFNKVSNALTSAALGDKGAINNVINEVAGNWKTSPETMREIVQSFHGHQLEAAGITLE
ncbi:MAG: hypothetical protein ACOYL6_11340 [Bacteriovoracaceae bacterium]